MSKVANRASSSKRISIFNLDAIEQSKLWLQAGPTEARRLLIGVLRTALLFGGTVVVDRNQLLEGVFFVAMPPERLAWHLGLEPGSALPITVQMLPSPSTSKVASGPWQVADDQWSWGVGADLVREIEANHAAIRDDPHRVSSPLIALTGGKYKHDAEREPEQALSSASGTVKPAWFRADPVVMPQHLWTAKNLHVASAVRARGRLAWVEAMQAGLVEVRSSTGLMANPIGPELDSDLPPGAGENAHVTEIVAALIGLECANDTDREKAAPCKAVHYGETEPCQRAHVTVRSLVARWLDGETVASLSPPRLPQSLRDPNLATHRRCALGWWTMSYTRAICNRDELRLLTIYNALPSPSGIDDDQAVAAELAWGLRRTKDRFRDWVLSRRRLLSRAEATSTLPIAGDVVERLAAFSPAEYTRLQAFEAVGSSALLNSPNRRALFDLVIAIDEIAGDTTSRSRRMRSTILRGTAVSVVGLAIVLYENGFIALSGPIWAVVAFLAAALLAAPWSDLGTLRRMSGAKLQTTLRFQA